MLIMLKWWLVAALAQVGRAAVLLPRGLGREPRALFTDYVTIDVTLDAGERAALLYANGSLVLELPAKRWAWEASPPCEPGTAARRNGRARPGLTSESGDHGLIGERA